jgi:hypothetical protein
MIFDDSRIQKLKEEELITNNSENIMTDYYFSTTLFNKIRSSYGNT